MMPELQALRAFVRAYGVEAGHIECVRHRMDIAYRVILVDGRVVAVRVANMPMRSLAVIGLGPGDGEPEPRLEAGMRTAG